MTPFDVLNADMKDATPRKWIVCIATGKKGRHSARTIVDVVSDDPGTLRDLQNCVAYRNGWFDFVRKVMTNAEAFQCFCVEVCSGVPSRVTGARLTVDGKIESNGTRLVQDERMKVGR